MRYWYAEDPDSPKEFAYSQGQYESDEEFIRTLIHEIRSMESEEFPLTDDPRKCRYCLYRSLCDRGVGAGTMEEYNQELDMLEEWPETFDLDEIPVIEF